MSIPPLDFSRFTPSRVLVAARNAAMAAVLGVLIGPHADATIMLPNGEPDPDFPNLVYWLDADDLASFALTNGNEVSSWVDRASGVVGIASGGGVVTRQNGAINGHATVQFDGSGYLSLSSTVTLAGGLNQTSSAFVVAKTTDSSGGDTVMSRGGSNVQFFRQNGTQVRFFKGTNPDPTITADTVTANRVRYAEFTGAPKPDGDVRYYVNGSELAVSNAGNIGTQDWQLNRVGGGGGCCGNWNGDIAEILLYDRALDAEEQNAVGYYLSQKYGIATGYTPTTPVISSFTVSDGGITDTSIAVPENTDVTIAWNVSDADSVGILPSIGAVGSSGSQVINSGTSTTTYTLTATNAEGDSTAEVTVFVVGDPDPPTITEFLANPTGTTLADEDGDTEDWIEISNPNPFAIDVGGYFLSDDPSGVDRWQIPSPTVIPANGFLIVFASSKDRAVSGSELHTDFKLSSGGDHLTLYETDGVTVLSTYTWSSSHPSGVSYGVDGSPPMEHFFQSPSPGAANAPPYYLAGKVLFSVESSTFTSSFSLTLSSEVPGMEIRYTTDRSEPDGSSDLYTGPFSISDSTMLRARLVDPADSNVQGDVSARNYLKLSSQTISPGAQAGATTLDGFTSNLPIIVLDNFGGSGANRDTLTTTTITVFEPVGGVTSMTDAPAVSTRAGYRIRGASSSGFPKKQYRVELWNQENEDKSEPLLGLPSDADWVLGAPYSDKALIRNTLVFELGRALGLEAPRTRHVEVFVNENGGDLNYDSDYKGVYFLAEKIKISEDRVDVTPLNPSDNSEPEITGGYIARQEYGASSSANRLPDTSHTEMVDPDAQKQATTAQKQWMSDYLHDLDDALDGPDFKDPVLGYRPFIDMDSFVNLFVINELTRDQDGYMRSNYFHKERGGPLVQGPLWDYNLTMGVGCCRNNTNSVPTGGDTGWQYIENNGPNEWKWETRLDDDEDFWQAFIDRWQELRRDMLSDAGLHARIDAHVAELPVPAVRNFAEWNILGDSRPGFPSPVTATWEEQIDLIKTWTSQRMAWIDSQFTSPPAISLAGGVVVNGTNVTVGGGAGTVYFTDDGSDPRLPGGGINPNAMVATSLPITGTTTLIARSLSGGDWSGPVSETYIVGIPASPDNLVVSELNYHPSDPTPAEVAAGFLDDGDFEFIELQNISQDTIELTGVRFDAGIDFSFADNTTLPPGGRILVVRNRQAFLMRYPGVPVSDIAGEFENDTQLSNGSETVALLAFDGTPIKSFTYFDVFPWPTEADGGGFTMVLMLPETNPDHSLAASWRASSTAGGNPADTDVVPFVGDPHVDGDGDMFSALVEHGLGSSDSDSGSGPELLQVGIGAYDVGGVIDNYLTVSFQRNLLAEDVEISAEVSEDLANWESGPAHVVFVSEVRIDGFRSVVTYRSVNPVGALSRHFGRIAVSTGG